MGKVKKVINVRRCPIFHSKTSEAQKKKGHHDRKCPIFLSISIRNKIYISVSARGPHKMISRATSCGPRAVVCPPLGYATKYRVDVAYVMVRTKKSLHYFVGAKKTKSCVQPTDDSKDKHRIDFISSGYRCSS